MMNTKYIGFCDDEYKVFPSIIQERILSEATEEYMTELKDRIKYRNLYESFEFYDNELYTNRSIDNINYKYAYCNINGYADENVNHNISAAANEYVRRYVAEY